MFLDPQMQQEINIIVCVAIPAGVQGIILLALSCFENHLGTIITPTVTQYQ